MRNKNLFFCLLFTLFLFCCSAVHAQNTTLDPSQESITNFRSNISVNLDNSIDVEETIVYNTGKTERHGLLRDIISKSSVGSQMKIMGVSATDENGNPYIFSTTSSGTNFEIKIGDPNKTFVGSKTYIIKYHATKAVAQFKDFDEIYWNVTGNDWKIPIYEASASVFLPDQVVAIQFSCYYGPRGSTERCNNVKSNTGPYRFVAPGALSAGEGLTVAVGFPKGVVAPYTARDKFFDAYFFWLVAIALPLLTLIFSLWYWYKKGRDPKGTGVIVPQYDVPEDLTPLEVGGIVKEKVEIKNISAEIIYLATRGYLKINQLEEKFIGLFKTTDYELIKLKDFSDIKNDFDKKLLTSLFSERPRLSLSTYINLFKGIPPTEPEVSQLSSVKLSDLRNVFYKETRTVMLSLLDSLLNKGYYKNLGRMKNSTRGIIGIVFLVVWGAFFVGGVSGAIFSIDNFILLLISAIISIIIYMTVAHFFPAKTEKGVMLKEYLLGLKEYLQIAEKDRLIFHNASETKPEVFEKLLPFAMVLGVADIWAKEFEGIYTTPPSWYSGPSGAGFNAVVFNHSLSNFSTYAISSLSSSPSGSGSGGGGSSGGGGGGGGGGGW